MGKHWRTKEEARLTIIAATGGMLDEVSDRDEIIRALRIVGVKIAGDMVRYVKSGDVWMNLYNARIKESATTKHLERHISGATLIEVTRWVAKELGYGQG